MSWIQRSRTALDLRLYAIVDGDFSRDQDLAALAQKAVAGGATVLQYRDKQADTATMIARARAIRARVPGVPLIINDRVDIALAVGADGVHVGRQDMAPAEARRLLGPAAIIGVTIKDERDLGGLSAGRVDYGAIGGVFATTSKDNADPPIGLAGLKTLGAKVAALGLPVSAIAGITAANAAEVIMAGADGIAVIGALFGAGDVTGAARTLRGVVDAALVERAGAAFGDAAGSRTHTFVRPARAAIAVTIAGSDSGGGAGIQADLKTFSALGVYGASVVTALTAQNTLGVQGIEAVSPAFVSQQIESVFSDLAVDAVKIGMLANPAIIEAVADGLARFHHGPIVLDPVMVAQSGDRLVSQAAMTALIARLIPMAIVVTPNLPEAAALTGADLAADDEAMIRQAEAIVAMGARTVLIKGGHAGGAESVDWLVDWNGNGTSHAAPRLATRHTHGTGCTLSSAIAAGLAKGLLFDRAVREAKAYVHSAIAAAERLKIGTGAGPTHHFHAWW